MKRLLFFLFLPFVLLLFSPSLVSAESKSLLVDQDTYANSGYPNDPKDSAGSVIISNKYVDRLGYIQFNKLNLPEEAIIDQAIFHFYIHELNYSDSAKLNIGPISQDWQENNLTWNNKPSINLAQSIEVEISLTGFGFRQINITNIVRQWHQGLIENKGIFIYPYGFLYGGAEAEFAFSLRSKDSGENLASLAVYYHLPEPTNTPTPEPTAFPEPTTPYAPTSTYNPSSTIIPSDTEGIIKSPVSKVSSVASDEDETAAESARTFSPLLTALELIILLAIAALGSILLYIRFKKQKGTKKKK